jgi:FSR family fosmidomycin resistance protein-like MFS transporter
LSTVEGYQRGRVVSMGVAHLVHDTYASFLAPLLPAFIEKLALSKTEAGLLAFLQSSPSLLQPFIGHLADRVTLRYFVILGPAVTATMMSLLGVAPNYAVLALLLIVTGLSSAAFHAVAPAMAGRLSGQKLGWGMGLWSRFSDPGGHTLADDWWPVGLGVSLFMAQRCASAPSDI